MSLNDKLDKEELVRAVCNTIKQSLIQGLQKGNQQSVHPGTILGIIIGGIFCIAGFILGCLGLAGSIEWIFQAGSFSSKMSNASPGVLLCLMGMIILWRYRPKYRQEITIHPIEIKITSGKDITEIKGPRIESRSASSPITTPRSYGDFNKFR